MDDDLNISNALAHIFDFVKETNILIMQNNIGKKDADDILKAMFDLDKVLGILEEKQEKIPTKIKNLIKEREKARKEGNFAEADKIRKEIEDKGYVLEDTKEGTRVKKI